MVDEIQGKQFGVRFVDRGDGHVMFQIISENDDDWSKLGEPASSFWLDDLIEVLQAAKTALESMPKDPAGFGYRFWEQR